MRFWSIKEGDRYPAVEAMWKEANNLTSKRTWLLETVKPWHQVAAEARAKAEVGAMGGDWAVTRVTGKRSRPAAGTPRNRRGGRTPV